MPISRRGRTKDRDDPSVWAVTCFVIGTGRRRQGHSARMLAAAGFREVTHPTKRRYVMRPELRPAS